MKKPALILALFLFAACAVAGYMLASKNSPTTTSNPADPSHSATALAESQQNFLLIQVDDLTLSNPKLIQAWIVLTYYSSPPQVIFLPLYPSYDSSQNTAISEAFGMTASGTLTNRLEQEISSLYKVKVDGFIMTDAFGLKSIASWFGIQGIQAGTVPAKSDDDKHAILLNSQSFFQNVCSQLMAGKAMNQYTSMQWSQLIPYHFQTNLSFEQLIASWDRVTHSAPPQQCEVLSKE